MFGSERLLVIEILGHHTLLAFLSLKLFQLLVLLLPDILSVDGIAITDRAQSKYQSKHDRRTPLKGEQRSQPSWHRTVVVYLAHSIVLL
jgi:hypothetical protein